MDIVSIDLETYYDQEYSLKKMPVVQYVLDPRFQLILGSVKINDGAQEVYYGHEQLRSRLAEIDWSRTAWLSHHVNFDGSIGFWKFGIEPKLYLCTLSMARAVTHWTLGRSDLANVSKYLKLPPKGDELLRTIGKRLENFTKEELARFGEYCARDNENAWLIFKHLRPRFIDEELRLIDLVSRMHIIPQVKLSPGVLAEHLAAVQAEKDRVLGAVGYLDTSVLSSQPQFAALLEGYGVEVPTKLSPTTGQPIPALAKNDRAFRELCEDPEQPVEVQALLAARLKIKSTIEETRTARLLKLSQLQWPDGTSGWAAIPLKFYAARTGRLGGDDYTNWQNIKRGSRIREAVEAPSGWRVVHRDSSQIEARLVAWLAECEVLTAAFAAGTDVYAMFASSVYGFEVNKTSHPNERFCGKTGILGLGYGCGAAKFRHMLYIGSGGMSLRVDDATALRVVNQYRYDYPEIPALWKGCGQIIEEVIEKSGREAYRNHDIPIPPRLPIRITADAVWLPNNMCLSYPELRYEYNDKEGKYDTIYKNTYGGTAKLYGAKLCENLCQALARIIVTNIAIRVFEDTQVHPFLSTHDSLTYCVPEGQVEWWDKRLTHEFSIVPVWATGLPLASEGGWGKNMLAAEKGVNT